MRVLSLSAIIVSATATASCARRCGTACRATTAPKQVPFGGAGQVPFGGAGQPVGYYPQYPQYPQYPYPQYPQYPQYPYPQYPQQPPLYPQYPQYPYPQYPQYPGQYPPQYYQPQPQYPPPAPVYPGFYPPPQQNPYYPYPPYPGVAPGCEGAAGSCSCDDECTSFNDCCVDYVYYCSSGSGTTTPSPFGTKTDGQSCGVGAFGDAGNCQVGLDCVCVGDCADPAIADAPTTCKQGSCFKVCPALYQPICGTDGYQYSNRCEFEIAVCQYSYLQIAYEGECRAPTVAPPTLPAATCGTLRDCVSCASVYQCAWDGRTCFQSFQQLPPPFVNVPSQCPVIPQQCPIYSDCSTCATAPGCTWFGTYCQYSQYPINGYPNDPRQCPNTVPQPQCSAQTSCGTCTGQLGCFWATVAVTSIPKCVYSPSNAPLPFPGYLSFPNQCPTTSNTCSTQYNCNDCAIINGCSWSGTVCIDTLTPITGCSQFGCANTVNQCQAAPAGR